MGGMVDVFIRPVYCIRNTTSKQAKSTATYKSKQFTLPEAAVTKARTYTDPMIQGLVQLFIFQALGELVSMFALPFIPGPVLGLVLLLAYLSVRGHVPAAIDLVGGSVLQHLGLLFIPASVGVVLYLPVLQANAWAISAALVVSVVATVAVTAGLLKVLAKKAPTDA